MIVVIILSIVVVFFLIAMLAACKAASIADQYMEIAFGEWLDRHPEEKEKYLREHQEMALTEP